jgi:S-adenosylmethionine decarboxylase
MPGTDAASRYPELRRQQAFTPKALHAVDAALTASSPVTDIAVLTSLATEAVAAGDGHVLEASHVSFGNGAVTLVLILAESHLSIHTWPEEQLIAIDLFSCGAINADAVLARLITSLRLEKVQTRHIRRGALS